MVGQQAANTGSYDRIAEQWDAVRRKRPVDPCIEALAEMLPAGARILDVGCGTGWPIDVYLDGRGLSVTGIDPSGNMLARAQALGLSRAEFRHAGLFEYEADEAFDAVIAFDSLFHIPLELQERIYPRISGFLKKGGLFLFTHGLRTGDVSGEMFGEPFYYSALDEDRLLACLEKASLEVLRFCKDYEDPVTGTRDLLALTRKRG